MTANLPRSEQGGARPSVSAQPTPDKPGALSQPSGPIRSRWIGFLAGLCLAASALALTLAPSAQAATNLLVTSAILRDASGNPLADNALVALVANPTGTTFGLPVAGTAVAPGAVFPGGAVVMATWSVSSARSGLAGGAFSVVALSYQSLGNGLASGQPMALYWFPTIYSSATPLPVGAAVGVFTSTATTLADRSTILWTTPDDSAGANQELNFLTTDAGGSVSPSLASAGLAAATPTAPSLSVQPQSQTAAQSGQTVVFSVTAAGAPAPTYQWYFNGALLSGATNASLRLVNAGASVVGNYYVVVSNSQGTVTSSTVTFNIDQVGNTAAQVPVGPPTGYVAGQSQTITNTVTYNGTATALTWSVLLPAGWSYASDTAGAATSPVVGQTGVIEWTWTAVPASPVSFTYTLNIPSGQTGAVQITSLVGVNNGTALQFLAQPDPLTLAQILYHSADENQDHKISLMELTRVIELYNTHNGTTRTGAYGVQVGSEDGFAPDSSRTSSQTVSLSAYHSADENQDGKISLVELTRVIELYNFHSGATRTGQYHPQSGTEDGFAPGP